MLKIIVPVAMALAAAGSSADLRVIAVPDPGERLAPLPVHVGGRVEGRGARLTRQWPGGYFETAFRGTSAFFRVGAGDVRLKVQVDGRPAGTLAKPAPGLFRIAGLTPGPHTLRVDVASESQAAPTVFGGFSAGSGTVAEHLPSRRRQIEFIGDSHTVGYANTSAKQDCTQDEVWASTDASIGMGPILAGRFGADYQINAISGRGVVRNYGGFAAPTLPAAYPFVLFDGKERAAAADWHPQVIVVALGTNDFSTPLHAGEEWATREALHADFEATYVRFVRALRMRHPHAFFMLWATDMADGEIETEVGRVAETLRAGGEKRLAYLPIDNLSFSACHHHPSQADDELIASKLRQALESLPEAWSS